MATDTLYKLHDGLNNQFGVLTDSGARKPSFTALANVLASPTGSPSKITLMLRRSNGHLVARGSAPVGDYMRLEAFKAGTLRFRATFTLDRFNHYSLSLPSVLGSRHLRVRVYQEWTGRGGRRPEAHLSGYSALRSSATTVSTRIFTSSPSDQLAM